MMNVIVSQTEVHQALLRFWCLSFMQVFLLNFQKQPSFLTNVNKMFSEQTS